jgi:hypothetical protein
MSPSSPFFLFFLLLTLLLLFSVRAGSFARAFDAFLNAMGFCFLVKSCQPGNEKEKRWENPLATVAAVVSLSLSLPLYYFSRSFSMFHFLFYTVREGTVLQGDGK